MTYSENFRKILKTIGVILKTSGETLENYIEIAGNVKRML